MIKGTLSVNKSHFYGFATVLATERVVRRIRMARDQFRKISDPYHNFQSDEDV